MNRIFELEIRIYLESLKERLMNYDIAIFIIAAIVTFIGLISNLVQNKNFSKFLIIIGAVLIIMSVVLYCQQYIGDKAKSNSGIISSESSNITYPCIYWGITRTENGPEGVSPIIQIGNDKMYVLVENGKLKVSAIIRDESGKIMGEIRDNAFEAFPPYSPRSRHDDYGWEVLDPYGRVALQVDLTGSCAHIAGIFYSEDGNFGIIFPNNAPWITFSGPSNQIKENITHLLMEKPDLITPIFDYRSDKPFGERINK